MRSTLLFLSLAGAMTCVSLAQQAAVSGFIKDPTGAVVPKANVTIVKADTSAQLSTSSGEAGFYEFSSLQPGRYEIRVDRAGFQSLVRGDLSLHIGDRVR